MILTELWRFVVEQRQQSVPGKQFCASHRMRLTRCYTVCRLHVTLLLLLLLLRHLGYQRGACPSSLLLEICLLQHKIGFLLFYCSHSLLYISQQIKTTLPYVPAVAVLRSVVMHMSGRIRLGLKSRLALTSRNLLSCLSCPFSALSCVTTRMASATMLVLSVLTSLRGSKALESSAKLRHIMMLSTGYMDKKLCMSLALQTLLSMCS